MAVEAIIRRRNMDKPSKPSKGVQGRGERRPLYHKKVKGAPKAPEVSHRYPIERKLKL